MEAIIINVSNKSGALFILISRYYYIYVYTFVLLHHYLLSFHHVHSLVEADILIALHHASES
jgi:hypothetical protein